MADSLSFILLYFLVR